MAMLAFLAGDDWETSPAQQAGTSPVGIGGTLEQFPSVLFPAYPECALSNADPLPGADWAKGYGDGNSGVETRWAHQPAEQSVRAACGLKLQDAITNAPNLPTDFPGLTLPTHVDHDGATVAAASVRVRMLGGTLTEAEMRAVLSVAGWPEALHSEALAVAFCESKWSPFALGDSGRSAGLFQLNIATWFRYAGEDAERWADPLVNARVALATYYYDLGRGYRPWTQWSCRSAVY